MESKKDIPDRASTLYQVWGKCFLHLYKIACVFQLPVYVFLLAFHVSKDSPADRDALRNLFLIDFFVYCNMQLFDFFQWLIFIAPRSYGMYSEWCFHCFQGSHCTGRFSRAAQIHFIDADKYDLHLELYACFRHLIEGKTIFCMWGQQPFLCTW